MQAAHRCPAPVLPQVAALFERVQREQGRLDLLVNAVWGGNELPSLQVCALAGWHVRSAAHSHRTPGLPGTLLLFG